MNARGAVLFETVALVMLLVATLFFAELEMIRLCNERVQALQTQRRPYTGRRRW